MIETIGFVMMSVGLGFDVVGCIGLVRLPDVYARLQVSTKCVTLGTVLMMIGVFLITGPTAAGVKTLLCMLFLLMASPAAAHALARGCLRAGLVPKTSDEEQKK